MGTYVVLYCLELKQWIEPGDINDGPMKHQDVAGASALGCLLVHLLNHGTGSEPWPSVRMAGDQWRPRPDLPSHEEITTNRWASERHHNDWRDVTREAIESYNRCFPAMPQLRYTPHLEE